MVTTTTRPSAFRPASSHSSSSSSSAKSLSRPRIDRDGYFLDAPRPGTVVFLPEEDDRRLRSSWVYCRLLNKLWGPNPFGHPLLVIGVSPEFGMVRCLQMTSLDNKKGRVHKASWWANYVPIEDPEQWMQRHESRCPDLRLAGRWLMKKPTAVNQEGPVLLEWDVLRPYLDGSRVMEEASFADLMKLYDDFRQPRKFDLQPPEATRVQTPSPPRPPPPPPPSSEEKRRRMGASWRSR